MVIIRAAAIVAACFFAADAAQAQHLTMTAISGRPLKLNFSNTTNPDCTAVGETVVKLTQEPQHGRVTISKASDFPSFQKKNVRYTCNKKRVSGTKTVYVSERGFTGTDHASIEIIFATGSTARRSYTINVR